MDETGQAGDTGTADGGTGADARDRTLSNGWATPDSPWSSAGAALDPAAEVPAWRRPSTEIRPFTRERSYSPQPRDPGETGPSTDIGPSTEVRPTGEIEQRLQNAAAPRWSDSRSRYADLLAHLSPEPNGTGPRPAEEPRPDPLGSDPLGSGPLGADPLGSEFLGTGPLPTGDVGARTTEMRPVAAARPSSAPPYPYEGDLDDTVRREPLRPPVIDGRAAMPVDRASERLAFPAVRPSTPGGRTGGWSAPESRHAIDQNTPSQGFPKIGQASVPQQPGPAPAQGAPVAQPDGPGTPADAAPQRSSYDPTSFPRRLPYETPHARPGYEPGRPGETSGGYPRPEGFAGFPNRPTGGTGTGRSSERGLRTLPQRVPAEPDVPTVPVPPVESPAEVPALARIATHLRRGDVLSSSEERQEGFDVNAILAAVREVDGVRDASLRTTAAGAHSLRLDLSEGADPAEVSRMVARLLQDTMGLDAAAMGATEAPTADVPAPRAPSAGSSPEGPSGGPLAGGPLHEGPLSGGPLDGPDPQAPSAGSAPMGAPYVPTQPIPAGRAPVSGAGAGSITATPGAAGSGRAPGEGSGSYSRPVRAPGESSGSYPRPTRAPGETTGSHARPQPAAQPTAQPAARPAGTPAADQQSGAAQASTARSEAARSEAARSEDDRSEAAPSSTAQSGTAQAETARAETAQAGTARSETAQAGSPTEYAGTVERLPADVEPAQPRPLIPAERPGPRVVIENVQVNTFGIEATVEVRLSAGERAASGVATGPAVDGYLLRLCAMATAGAVDDLLSFSDHVDGPARCFVEHAAAVPFGASQVAVVVLLLSCGGWVEQLAGSAVVTGDDRHAMVRATLAAVNRRLEALLS